MRVLVTFGSKRGGTAGLAETLAAELQSLGHQVELRPAGELRRLPPYDAVVVGGALYANRWHRDARRFVERHVEVLRGVPVWFFSSGPLDDSADRAAIPPTTQVKVLMDRVGAQGHVTFGGRLAQDARGFPARSMAVKHAGDHRNPERVRAWALEIGGALPTARPRVPIEDAARSRVRLLIHALAGWAFCAAVMAALLSLVSLPAALVTHLVAAPLIFGAIAVRYFRPAGARTPLVTAFTFTGTTALLDLVVVAGAALHDFGMFRSVLGTWLPLGLIFLVTWTVGEVSSMVPRRSVKVAH